MRVAVTGTPGTGKTTATGHLADRLEGSPVDEVVHLGEHLEREELYTEVDESRGSLVADIDALEEWAAERDRVLFESHLAHHLSVDRVAVLRCAPAELERRLEERGVDPESIAENATSEALDIILAAAVERHGSEAVYEVDTTAESPAAVAEELLAIIDGDRQPSAGTVDFTGYLQ